MSQATQILSAALHNQAAKLTQVGAQDFESFVAPALRDLDLILSTPDSNLRAQLQRALKAQLMSGVPELARVTGSRAAADTIANVVNIGVDLLADLVVSGAVSLAGTLGDENQ
jgi:hypothetical protein